MSPDLLSARLVQQGPSNHPDPPVPLDPWHLSHLSHRAIQRYLLARSDPSARSDPRHLLPLLLPLGPRRLSHPEVRLDLLARSVPQHLSHPEVRLDLLARSVPRHLSHPEVRLVPLDPSVRLVPPARL